MTMIFQELINKSFDENDPMRNFSKCKAAFKDLTKWGLKYVSIEDITSSNIEMAKEIIESINYRHFHTCGIYNLYLEFEQGKILLGTDDSYGNDSLLGYNVYSYRKDKSGEIEYLNNREEEILHLGGADEEYDWKSRQIQVFNSKGIQLEQKIVINRLAGHFCDRKDIKGYSIKRALDSVEGLYTLFVKVYDKKQIKSCDNKEIEFDETKKPKEYIITLPETVGSEKEHVDPSKFPDIEYIIQEIEKINKGQSMKTDIKSINDRFVRDFSKYPDFKEALRKTDIKDAFCKMWLTSRGLEFRD